MVVQVTMPSVSSKTPRPAIKPAVHVEDAVLRFVDADPPPDDRARRPARGQVEAEQAVPGDPDEDPAGRLRAGEADRGPIAGSVTV